MGTDSNHDFVFMHEQCVSDLNLFAKFIEYLLAYYDRHIFYQNIVLSHDVKQYNVPYPHTPER